MSKGGGGGGGDTTSSGENFMTSSGSNWNSTGSDTRSLNASQSRTNQDVWDKQSPYLEAGYKHAADTGVALSPQYQQAGKDAQNWNKAVGGVMAPVMAQQAAGGVYGEGGAGQGLMQANQGIMDNGMGQSQWGGASNFGNVNPYVDAQKQAIAADAGVAGNQMMNSMDARAAAGGMSGGSRHGTAIAQGMGDINRNMQNAQANVGFQANEAAQGRRMQSEEAERARRYGAGESQLGRQMTGAQNMQNMYNTQEATTNNMVANTGNIMNLGMKSFDPLNAQWGNLQNYNAAIGGPNNLTQSSTDSLNMSGTQQRGSGGGVNQSAGYGYTNADGTTNPSWNLSVGGGNE